MLTRPYRSTEGKRIGNTSAFCQHIKRPTKRQPTVGRGMPKFRTKVGKSASRSESLRTTVPAALAAFMEVGVGDELEWIIEPGSLRVVVRRVPPAERRR